MTASLSLSLIGQILDSILDVTVGYPRTMIQSELQTLRGEFPEEIHFFVEDHPIHTLPSTNVELEDWLKTLWSAKEERLKRFYAQGSFETDQGDRDVSVSAKPVDELKVRSILYAVVVFWVVFLLVVFIGLLVSRLFQVFCLISSVIYVYIGLKHGGLDNVTYATMKQ